MYLSGSESNHLNGGSIRTLLYLLDKLSQLGVCPAAVVDLTPRQREGERERGMEREKGGMLGERRGISERVSVAQ